MGKLYKRGDIWYYSISIKGRRIRRSTGATNKALATKIMQNLEAKATLEHYDIDSKNLSLEEFWKRISEYSKTNHSPTTIERYHTVMDHFRDFLRDHPEIKKISQIRPELIERYKTYRLHTPTNPNGMKGKKKYTKSGAHPGTINLELTALRAFFNLAIKWGYLRKNPTRGVNMLKVKDKKQPRFLSQDECEKLLKAAQGYMREIIFTLLNTGMRRGELENLEWNDIDFRNRRIRIMAKKDWKPKTGAREIPMTEGLVKLLKAKKKKSQDSPYVFPGRNGRRIGIDLRMKLLETAREAGIEGLTRIHDLRHTFASQLVMKGVDLPTVQKLLGHTRIETTMIYSHLSDEHVSEAISKIEFNMK
jgi:integrase